MTCAIHSLNWITIVSVCYKFKIVNFSINTCDSGQKFLNLCFACDINLVLRRVPPAMSERQRRQSDCANAHVDPHPCCPHRPQSGHLGRRSVMFLIIVSVRDEPRHRNRDMVAPTSLRRQTVQRHREAPNPDGETRKISQNELP